MAAIKLKISVAELENVLTLFNRIKVYRADDGISGTYSEITDEDSRIRLQQGITLYLFDDAAGQTTSWYKTSYYHTDTALESGQSDPRQGEDMELNSLVMSVQDLKDIYLFGVDLTNDLGEPFPDVMFEWSIKFAIDWLEHELDIRLRPTTMDERYDYYRRDFSEWMFIKLRQSPVISVEQVALMWPANTEVMVFPAEWISLIKDCGHINIVPTSTGISQVLFTAGGTFLPLLAQGRDYIPNAIRVQYTAGFEAGKLPFDLRELIGKKAACGPLNVAGDLIAGAGIASQSVSLDGVSQSISTTSSATNAGYGARIIQYEKEIKAWLPMLRNFYKGVRLAAV
ncbi:MAG: hypothetical protein MUC88_00030 [Planctomycetes bacterium]|jgi:hypothetical protein|nr:hypothetical protein [Planctomycetota bacterium]